MSIKKTLEKVMSGKQDYNISFNEMLALLRGLDFDERIKGSHHIFARHDVEGVINLQPVGSLVKGYQVAQVRKVFKHNNLGG